MSTEQPAGSPVEYSEQYRVPFGDTDAAGVVFYPNYYRWFDRMTHELMRQIGHPLGPHLETGQAPVLAETGCRFVSSARYDDVLTLTVRVREIRRRGFTVDHEVSRDGGLIAVGFEVRIWVSLDGGEIAAIPLPADLRAALSSTT